MPFPIKSFEILSSLRAEMQKHRATLRLLMDHPGQIQALERLLEAEGRETEAWSIFLKLDVGTQSATFLPDVGVEDPTDILCDSQSGGPAY